MQKAGAKEDGEVPDVRMEHASGKWWLSKAEYRHARSYALMYWEWEAQLRRIAGIKRGGADEGMPKAVGASDPTARDAERMEEVWVKMVKVDESLRLASPTLWRWLKDGVTREGVTYDALSAKGMPCGRSLYYEARKKFYWLLSRRI